MNYSYLLSEIIKGQWALDPETMMSLMPLVKSLFENDSSKVVARDEWTPSFSDSENIETGTLYSDAPPNSTAIIPLSGTMLKYGTMCAYGTSEIASFLNQALNAKNISSCVLLIDSGGGAVNSIPPLLDAIRSSNKPIVALCDTAASAAYFVASECDHIMADNNLSARFGSIGVVTSFVDMQPFLEKQGYKFHTVFAPESTHKNLAFTEALKGNYDALKEEILSPMAIAFQNHVKSARGNKLIAETPGILAGATYYADKSLEIGLIDSVGNLSAAITKANELAEISQYMNSDY